MMEITHTYLDLFISLCSEHEWDTIHEMSIERCNGCEMKLPSQSEHSCLMDSAEMKLIMNFELAYMKLNIREICRSMLRDHDCDGMEIKSLWKIMKTFCCTDLWKIELYSQLERKCKSIDGFDNE